MVLLLLGPVGQANVNAASSLGNTPLHVAAMAGNVELARLLLGAGAQPRTANRAGRTAVDVAVTDEVRRALQATTLPKRASFFGGP